MGCGDTGACASRTHRLCIYWGPCCLSTPSALQGIPQTSWGPSCPPAPSPARAPNFKNPGSVERAESCLALPHPPLGKPKRVPQNACSGAPASVDCPWSQAFQRESRSGYDWQEGMQGQSRGDGECMEEIVPSKLPDTPKTPCSVPVVAQQGMPPCPHSVVQFLPRSTFVSILGSSLDSP